MLTLMQDDAVLIAGVDEAGRGPLAGPVVAAAVILDPKKPILGLKDSKKLSEKKREALFVEIKAKALAFAISRAEVEEIDSLNILQASLLAMRRAVEALSLTPTLVLVDGNHLPLLKMPAKAIIKGDQTEACISAASILAKVYRDAEMIKLDLRYPHYAFATHKGYPTQQHAKLILEHGRSSVHRKSFQIPAIRS